MKEGYEPFVMVNGTIKLSVTVNGVTFSKAAVAKLGYPACVTLFINTGEKLLAIKPAKRNDVNAIDFYRENDCQIGSVRWNNTDLLWYLCSLMDWNLEENSYSVSGMIDYKEKIIEFDLKEAEVR